VRIAVISPAWTALVRLQPLVEILREDTDQFRPERRARSHRAGHDAEQMAVGQRDDRPQQLPRLAFRKGDHRVAHDRDAAVVGQPAGHFVPVDKAHVNPYPPREIRRRA